MIISEPKYELVQQTRLDVQVTAYALKGGLYHVINDFIRDRLSFGMLASMKIIVKKSAAYQYQIWRESLPDELHISSRDQQRNAVISTEYPPIDDFVILFNKGELVYYREPHFKREATEFINIYKYGPIAKHS